MNEAEILAKTYKDQLTVSRYYSYEDETTKEKKEGKKIVYASVPCALSQSKNATPARAGVLFQKDAEYILFTMPDIRIEENDCAEIVTQAGESIRGRTGRTFVYAGSHGETKIKIEGTA